MTFDAFTDSIDDLGAFNQGICGEKRVVLYSSAPAFLSITPHDIDPVTQPFTLKFDHT